MEQPRNTNILSPSKNINNKATDKTVWPSATQRLQQELFKMMTNKNSTISAFPEGENLLRWKATIEGPINTPYSGLHFKLSFIFSDKYPYKPPSVKFITPCFHPNIDIQGNICLDILNEEWSALFEVRTILLSLQSLLAEPNISSPLNCEAANMWKNQIEFKRTLLEKYEKESKQTLNQI
ncbi:hypothetical protein HZS_2539 [Henneguya salminicola]|nr:hypothetical protein HZS_2539 [Henneguya salminicola]